MCHDRFPYWPFDSCNNIVVFFCFLESTDTTERQQWQRFEYAQSYHSGISRTLAHFDAHQQTNQNLEYNLNPSKQSHLPYYVRVVCKELQLWFYVYICQSLRITCMIIQLVIFRLTRTLGLLYYTSRVRSACYTTHHVFVQPVILHITCTFSLLHYASRVCSAWHADQEALSTLREHRAGGRSAADAAWPWHRRSGRCCWRHWGRATETSQWCVSVTVCDLLCIKRAAQKRVWKYGLGHYVFLPYATTTLSSEQHYDGFHTAYVSKNDIQTRKNTKKPNGKTISRIRGWVRRFGTSYTNC